MQLATALRNKGALNQQMFKAIAKSMGLAESDSQVVSGQRPGMMELEDDRSTFPAVVRAALEFFARNGVSEEGLMRKSGSHDLIAVRLEEFRSNERTSFDDSSDPHLVSGVLKQYIRALKVPLVPPRLYKSCLAAAAIPDDEHAVRELRRLLKLISPVDAAILGHVGLLLKRIVDNADVTKMGVENCALVFGPTLLRLPGNETPSSPEAFNSWMADAKHQNRFVCLLLEYTEDMLPDLAPLSSMVYDPKSVENIRRMSSAAGNPVLRNYTAAVEGPTNSSVSVKEKAEEEAPPPVKVAPADKNYSDPTCDNLLMYALTRAPKLAFRAPNSAFVRLEGEGDVPIDVYATYTCGDVLYPWKTNSELWRVEETGGEGYFSIRSLQTHNCWTADPDVGVVSCASAGVTHGDSELFSIVPLAPSGPHSGRLCHVVIISKAGAAVSVDRDGQLVLAEKPAAFSVSLKVALLRKDSSSIALSARMNGTLKMNTLLLGIVLRAALWETFYVDFLEGNRVSIARFSMITGRKFCEVRKDGFVDASTKSLDKNTATTGFVIRWACGYGDVTESGHVDPFNGVKLATCDGLFLGTHRNRLIVCASSADVPCEFDFAFFPLDTR